MAESEYCDDYYEYTNDDCDEDCDNCNHKDCDEQFIDAIPLGVKTFNEISEYMQERNE